MVIVTRKEIEQLRPWIISQVKSILGFSEDTVVNAAIDCLAKSLSRSVATGEEHVIQAFNIISIVYALWCDTCSFGYVTMVTVTELLSTFLDDSTDKFTKALYEKVQEIKVSKETSGAVSSSGKKRNAKVCIAVFPYVD